MICLSVVNDFTDTPGVRYRHEGEYSGEQFREERLEPYYLRAVSKNEKLEVNLDGTFGYATSFLEEAFGGLAKKYGADEVMNRITIVSEEDKGLYEKINGYMWINPRHM